MSSDQTTLDEAVAAARALPIEQQQALAYEILERVAELGSDRLTAEQLDIVRQRLAAPPAYATNDEADFILHSRMR